MRGDTYEYLLSKIAQSGLNGQFRTPRHIIKMMVELMNPKADEVICDPACGTSGFLCGGRRVPEREPQRRNLLRPSEKNHHYMNHMFFGYDMDRTMLRIGAMNMMTHGIDNPYIEYRDSLSDQNPDKEKKYSLILANPPFKGSLDADTVSGRPAESLQNQENRTAFPRAVPAYAENRRALCLHCSRWCAIWLVHCAQGNPQGNWWTATVWRLLSRCRPACSSPMPVFPPLF